LVVVISVSRNRDGTEPGLCVQPIIMRQLSEVLSEIVKLSGVASGEQGAS
jgi:hypothetical protein